MIIITQNRTPILMKKSYPKKAPAVSRVNAHPNRGFCYERIHFDALEASLATKWEARCHEHWAGDLLYQIVGREVTNRERYVAASVIQWLGSSVGFSFLQGALSDAGWYIEGRQETFHDWEDSLLQSIKQAHNAQQAAQMNFDLTHPS